MRLRCDPSIIERFFEPLVDKPLMRRMLIDQDQCIVGLGDDVIGKDLRPRSTQRE